MPPNREAHPYPPHQSLFAFDVASRISAEEQFKLWKIHSLVPQRVISAARNAATGLDVAYSRDECLLGHLIRHGIAEFTDDRA
jgi:hypothetical protein